MIDTGAGVIDADYRGTVFVLLFNHAETDFIGKLGATSRQRYLNTDASPSFLEPLGNSQRRRQGGPVDPRKDRHSGGR
jgi:dUTP pyrophosphatase